VIGVVASFLILAFLDGSIFRVLIKVFPGVAVVFIARMVSMMCLSIGGCGCFLGGSSSYESVNFFEEVKVNRAKSVCDLLCELV